MSTPEAWHPDPSGRNQLRWWDGSRWTDWVSNGGQTSQDPVGEAQASQQSAEQTTRPEGAAIAPAPGADSGSPDWAQVEHLLSRPRLFVEFGGGTFAQPGWRTIADENSQPIGRIYREGRTAKVCDMAGNQFLEVSGRLVGRGSRSERSVGDLKVTGGGQLLAEVGFVQMGAITFKFDTAGQRVLECRVERSMKGEVKSGTITLADGRIVGSLTEYGRQTSGMVLRSWLVVDKDPNLPEPLRTLAVAAPLVFDVFSNPVGRDAL